jgi:gliding motility-associated-like protein
MRLLLFLLVISTLGLNAQSLYNNNSHLFIGSGTVFSVRDSLVNRSILTNNGNMVIGGVWLNQGTYNPGVGEITFNSPAGTGPQIINHNSQSFSKLTISGGGEKLILADMTIEGEFVLTDGVVTQQNDSKVIFAPTAIISGGSDQSHILATVVQQGSGDKLFPLGNGTIYLPIQLKGIGNSSEVGIKLNELSGVTLNKSRELKSISSTRYWELELISGSLDGSQIILPVRSEAIIQNIENAIVAEASDLSDPFRSLGQSGITGTALNGSVTSNQSPTKSLVAIGALSDKPEIVVYNAISPNSDNKNEKLIIGNIDLFPNHVVTIFNRWGDKVFEMKKYNNDERVFRGFSNVGSEKELGAGTYFYLIDKGDGSEKVNGFISIKR